MISKDSINIKGDFNPKYGLFFYWNNSLYAKIVELKINTSLDVYSSNDSHYETYDKLVPQPHPLDYEMVPRGRVIIKLLEDKSIRPIIMLSKYNLNDVDLIDKITKQFNLTRFDNIEITTDENEFGDSHYDISQTENAKILWDKINYLNSCILACEIRVDMLDEKQYKECISSQFPVDALVKYLRLYKDSIIQNLNFSSKILLSALNDVNTCISNIYNANVNIN